MTFPCQQIGWGQGRVQPPPAIPLTKAKEESLCFYPSTEVIWFFGRLFPIQQNIPTRLVFCWGSRTVAGGRQMSGRGEVASSGVILLWWYREKGLKYSYRKRKWHPPPICICLVLSEARLQPRVPHGRCHSWHQVCIPWSCAQPPPSTTRTPWRSEDFKYVTPNSRNFHYFLTHSSLTARERTAADLEPLISVPNCGFVDRTWYRICLSYCDSDN